MDWPTLTDAWAAFFHTPVSAATLALFRMVFAIVLLANAAGLARDLAFLYGPAGVLADAYRSSAFRHGLLDLLQWCPNRLSWLQGTLCLHIIAVALMLIGFQTQICAAIAFVTLTAIQSRNPLVTYGGDDVLRTMCFLLILSPAGATLSLDHWRETGMWISDRLVPAWPWRLMQLQVAVIYLKAAIAKLSGETWRDGRALYFATEVADFSRRRLAPWARRTLLLRAGAWGTIATEAALGIGVWFAEIRSLTLAAGVVLHLTLETYLNLYLFGAVMVACLTLFVEPAAVEGLGRAAGLQ